MYGVRPKIKLQYYVALTCVPAPNMDSLPVLLLLNGTKCHAHLSLRAGHHFLGRGTQASQAPPGARGPRLTLPVGSYRACPGSPSWLASVQSPMCASGQNLGQASLPRHVGESEAARTMCGILRHPDIGVSSRCYNDKFGGR